jgi:hypothetical protein
VPALPQAQPSPPDNKISSLTLGAKSLRASLAPKTPSFRAHNHECAQPSSALSLSNAGRRARMLTLMPAGAQPSDRLGYRMSWLHSHLTSNGTSPGRRCGHRAAFTGYRTSSSAALSLRARATGHPSSSDAGSACQPAGLSNALGARPSAPQRQCMGPLTRPTKEGSRFALD